MLLRADMDSKSLGASRSIQVYVPDTGRRIYSTVYFHHGLGFDSSSPWKETRLGNIALKYEFIIVTADAGDSWFVNDSVKGRFWEDFFAFELPEWIESEFPASPNREARGQCGYSMGGYGAMMLAFLHSDRFSAVSTHCGSFVFGHEYRPDRPEREAYMKVNAPPGGRYDLFRFAESGFRTGITRPAIRMDIGVDDYLIEQHRRFHKCLQENGVEHIYSEKEGNHSWSYVDSRLNDSLDFFSGCLRPGS